MVAPAFVHRHVARNALPPPASKPNILDKKRHRQRRAFQPASGGAVQNGAGFNNPLLQYATGTPPRLRDSYHAPSRPKEMSCRFRHCLDNTGSNRVIADLVNQDKGPGDGILVITVTHQGFCNVSWTSPISFSAIARCPFRLTVFLRPVPY